MSITASQVNELRQITGAGLMDCKAALIESGGDIDAAVDYLRKKGQKVSAKRADREANEGAVIAMTNGDGNKGVIIHLTSETDFVAKNEDFISFATSIAQTALDQSPADLNGLLSLEMDGATVGDKVDEQVAKIGEKIELRAYETVEGDGVVSYIHAGNKIGVLVGLNKNVSGDAEQAAKDAAMQIAAMAPLAVDRDGIDQETIDRELDVAREQAKEEGKPEEMLDKIAEGRLQKFFKENTLLQQAFVKDGSKTVGEALKEADADMTVTGFKRVAIGG